MVPAWSNRVHKLTNGHGADLIVDVGGKDTLDQSVQGLAYAGTLSVVGGLSGHDGNIPSRCRSAVPVKPRARKVVASKPMEWPFRNTTSPVYWRISSEAPAVA
jgi:NADPH:quinone reductase-like Zn-dependent oxidoreductase